MRTLVLLLLCSVVACWAGRRRLVTPREGDLFFDDLQPSTLARHRLELDRLDEYLREQGIAPLGDLLHWQARAGVLWLARYIHVQWRIGRLGLSNIGNLLSATKRMMMKMYASGLITEDPKLLLQPHWRQFTAWRRRLPPEFRRPVDVDLALAIATTMACAGTLSGWLGGIGVLAMFHCLLRPEELLTTSWTLILRFKRIKFGVEGLISILKAKTRGSFAVHQSVLIEDASLANLLDWTRRHLPGFLASGPFWPWPMTAFRRLWDWALDALKIKIKLLPGLRGGGAIWDMWAHQQNLPRTRRRGRWRQEATLEHYLQEGQALLAIEELPQGTRDSIEAVADLTTAVFDVNE